MMIACSVYVQALSVHAVEFSAAACASLHYTRFICLAFVLDPDIYPSDVWCNYDDGYFLKRKPVRNLYHKHI